MTRSNAASICTATLSHMWKTNYGLEIYGCGLCQVGVPCADGIPTPDMG